MAEEIDISKLHGVLKEYALSVEKDKVGTKGYGKLNTAQELKLFKEMVVRNGKQAELKRQLPYVKGVSVPTEKPAEESNQQKLNKKIINLMKEENSAENKQNLSNAVSQKLKWYI